MTINMVVLIKSELYDKVFTRLILSNGLGIICKLLFYRYTYLIIISLTIRGVRFCIAS